VAATAPAPWRFAFSGTLKSIYVIRWLLFSGGTAIAFAMVERLAFESERPLLGLGLGFLVGLGVFRGQLRPLRWPSLSLSQDALYLVQGKQVTTLPWSSIRAVVAEGHLVTLQLAQPLTAPSGEVIDQVKLDAKKLGTSVPLLTDALAPVVADRAARSALPTDGKLRALLRLP
jgi:hypothetical protein